MNEQASHSPLPDAHADDDEIRAYAQLMDRFGVGLVVHGSDGSTVFRNRAAAKWLDGPVPEWLTPDGRPLAASAHPALVAMTTRTPVFDQPLAIRNPGGIQMDFNVNAMPVLAKDERIRRVLVTLTDLTRSRDGKHSDDPAVNLDALTGLLNKRHAMERFENEIHRARRYGTTFTVAEIDIDLFHPLCDKYGAATGDVVLAGIGRLIRMNLREIDFAGRIGRDEFLLVLPHVSMKGAMVALERLRAQIEVATFTAKELRVTVSGGIAEYTGETSATLLERCESLMIHARNGGRNRYCLDIDIL